MIFGILKDIKEGENRVICTPAEVASIAAAGHTVLVQGGHRFWPYHYQVMHHAAVHGKKVLGICLGHQLIHGYFNIRNLAEKLGLHGDMGEITYRLLRDPGVDCDPLERVIGHRSEAMPRGQEDIAKQDVDIVPGTLLHQLLGKDKIRAASFPRLPHHPSL